MARELTLMAVHAHPDDEVLGTGGLFARCAEEGIRTVLVTCTNGEQGDAPGGLKPGQPGHDGDAVARLRLDELRASVAHLGIEHLELLGYRDSGMAGWDANGDPESFANVPLDVSSGRLAELIERYRPQVLVTYDENGGYGHPDHIQAHRIAVAATEATGIPDKLYYTAVPRSWVKEMFAMMRAAGIPMEDELPDDFGIPDEQITSVVDASAYVERKVKALRAHESQGENIFMLDLPDEMQNRILGAESFVRKHSRVAGAPDHETDLFAGLR
ncbi:PIG-L family deacetylase [Spongiactinospora sp. TRM90649]|uniref:PIG-L family deacetylase n=1 Tax=Spongiactinospora sp. TRM90649 TaxID=3031114 RepID=UPI0023F8F62B|nr:PIG-L family deacetylase [Spongiactinospora sp. TRM90649]MDF5751850.1 PIG-L family deacetylase [Spongiactinospora sp. TRM90649]